MTTKIKQCKILEGKWQNTIWATFDDGSECELLTYYPDEVQYCAYEFVGLTMDQARKFITIRGIDYLRR